MNAGTKAGVSAVTVVLAVVGAAAMTGTAASAAAIGIDQLRTQGEAITHGVTGVKSIDVEVGAADLTIRYGDGVDARLESDGGDLRGWSLDASGRTLEVRGPNRGFNWFIPDWFRDERPVTLVLPASLEGSDLKASLQAGALTIDGSFGGVVTTVDAGSLVVDGGASTVDVTVNAGRADISLDGVRTAKFTISAGKLVSELTAVPDEVSFEVNAGDLTLTLPDAEYDLRRDVSLGSLNSDLTQVPGASHRIDGKVAAGGAKLLRGR
ncbi:DUF4097 family beta strand repeat-containing protein [Microbacterium sp.]|uniref:DUF4097 family beta strand repeat-containing protein n=1 Tax=Microbacterium sp. TaxID=51671 RepID=UPI00333F927A